MKHKFYPFLFIALSIISCNPAKQTITADTGKLREKAIETLDSVYKHYSVSGSSLLRETYPFDASHEATYIIAQNQPNQYAYLWPYSGTFSAVNALYEATGDKQYYDILTQRVLPGLEAYFDTQRTPAAYASYINSAPQSDRFYDDNIWLGIDFADTYKLTGNPQYLEKAKLIWEFILSGTDDKLEGGIYWVEQKKESKNSCSNAPGAVLALKLFEATAEYTYFQQATALYEWTKKYLQDENDYLIYDNINLSGDVDKRKYPYNSGQMIQAAALLYKHTDNEAYLNDAHKIAESAYHYFFENYQSSEGNEFKILKKSDVWFIAVMMRGYIELYQQDGNDVYIKAFESNLSHAWNNMRDTSGLFNTDWKGIEKDNKKWLLTQAAMVEMYARISMK